MLEREGHQKINEGNRLNVNLGCYVINLKGFVEDMLHHTLSSG
jgi:hypothetical protein